ncbi:ParB/RepB/Spo0J family partition protein [Lentzea sp. DG1S-22]|uniref:ParB/RepB/Spo0J family partition protein n=1 Tax=Lentzea sp. DG1S-22 TaxID=3108822 RepID=UPI002E765E2A|nr:ParB/RepB/Spo0J family partition protein [Lentzea sp. DG1S-22]WVH77668.1 ParB/RepB/Spo0J family partition protein [Lentzea sp. DG1S-22]
MNARSVESVHSDKSSTKGQESSDPDTGFVLVTLLIDELLPADSPRSAGEDEEHVRVLAESGGELPPIVVHRKTMKVIDGAHRLRAAEMRGERTIRARLFDGSEIDAFVLAVEANTTHGLPLSRADRAAAAARIIGSHPEWSDRAIARVAGIAARTVGVIRRRATGGHCQLRTRIGQDGRARPLSTADGRRPAADLIESNPGSSLRQIAAATGISTGTVRDVRDRVERGEDPVPGRVRRGEELAVGVALRAGDPKSIVRDLKRDPALRFSETGRSLLRLLDAHAPMVEDREGLATNVPAHAAGMVAELARGYAGIWQKFAHELEQGSK